MFRRRPFRRPLRPLRRRGPHPEAPPLPPRVRRALAHANRLFEDGEFGEAARLFGHMSNRARERGMPIRAAELALQAARAHFAADDVAAALGWARKGLRQFIRSGRGERIPRVLSRIVEALRDRGYDAEADRVEQEVRRALEEKGLSLDEARQPATQMPEWRGPVPSPTLPARCGGCGASLVPDDLEWHDAHTASCIYCGTIAKTA